MWNNSAPNLLADGGGTVSASYSDVSGGYAGTGNINANPLFANAAAGNVELTNPSPCVDTGTATGAPAVDIVGQVRPEDIPGLGANGTGVEFDMGAYESRFPVVVSIVRADPTPTRAALAGFTVTFSKPVTGVDATDFVPVANGLAGVSVTDVAPISESVYLVTVGTGSGTGTLGLNAVDDDSIIEEDNAPLGGTGKGNGNYSGGAGYAVDTIPPSGTLQCAAPDPVNGSIGVTVALSEPSADFTIDKIATVNALVTGFAGVATSYTFTLVPAGQGVFSCVVPAQTFHDLVGNPNAVGSNTIMRTFDSLPPTGGISINNGSANTATPSVILTLSADDGAGSGVAQMQFSNDGATWTTAEAYATAKSWSLAAGADGPRAVYVKYQDAVGNWSDAIASAILLDTEPPAGTIAINSDTEFTASRNVTLMLAASDGSGSGVAKMQFSNDNATWSGWETFSSSKEWVLWSGEGPQTVYAQYKDVAGNTSAITISDSIRLDTTPPSGTLRINGGASSTNNATVTLALSADDGPGSGVAQMQFSNDGSTWTTAETYATTKSWSLAAGADGPRSVYVKYQDAIGNWSDAIASATLLDTEAPAGTIAINNDIEFIAGLDVTLMLSASDGSGSGVAKMQFSNDNATWSEPETYATTKAWTLASGSDGLRTVWVKYQDEAGTWSAAFSDTITLDTSLPNGTIAINGGCNLHAGARRHPDALSGDPVRHDHGDAAQRRQRELDRRGSLWHD